MKKFTVETDFGTYEDVTLTTGRYPVRLPGNFYNPIFIGMDSEEEGLLSVLTVNIGLPGMIDDSYTAIDTNNCPFAEAFLLENGIGKKTGRTVRSGYCEYPIYEINKELLKEFAANEGEPAV